MKFRKIINSAKVKEENEAIKKNYEIYKYVIF